jgi:hypothetical protein
MNQAKLAVLAQIDALTLTMTQVKETDGKIYMEAWIAQGVGGNYTALNEFFEEDAPQVEHFCGAAACRCGYQALSNRLEAFPLAAKTAYVLGGDKDQVSSEVGNSLVDVFDELFGNGCLGESIFQGVASDRRSEAVASGLFLPSELETLEHLNSAEPTADEVLEYLALCRAKVEQYDKFNQY